MKIHYYVEPKSALVKLSAVFMAAAFILRLIWCIVWREQLSVRLILLQAALPILSCALFIAFILACGRKALWASFFPVLLGVIFFALKATGFAWWHQLLCTILYLAVAALYGLTVFGVLPIRRLLIPLFGLPLLFHLIVQDLIMNFSVFTVAQWLQEGSVLFIMAALLCTAFAIKIEEKSSDE